LKVILNIQRSLGATVNQYEINDKILRTSKDLEAIPLNELIGILSVYEQVLQNDANITSKGKNLVFRISHKCKKMVSSKASEDTDNASDHTESDEEIPMLTNKVKGMFRKQKSKSKNIRFRTKDGKEQNEKIFCYGYKKSGHFKSERTNQVQGKRRKISSLKRRKVLCQPRRFGLGRL